MTPRRCAAPRLNFTVAEGVGLYVYVDDSATAEDLATWNAEREFSLDYFSRTGHHWIAHPSRKPPTHHMHAASAAGEVITISTGEIPISTGEIATLDGDAVIETVALECLSVDSPRVFGIDRFLTDAEADHLVRTDYT